jgi:O-antigen/teichoic acid export membrane protein
VKAEAADQSTHRDREILAARPAVGDTSQDALAGADRGAGKVGDSLLSLGAGEFASRFIAFFGTAYLARMLDPSGFGAIGFAAAVFGYFQLTVAAGFHDAGAREVARRPQSAPSIAAGVILVRFALAGAAQIALAIAVWSLNKPAPVKLIMILTGLSFFSLALDTSWVYKGLERNRPAAIALVLGQALFVRAVLLFVRGPADAARVSLAQFFGEMGAALLLAVPLLRHRVGGGRIDLDLREGWEIFRTSWSLTLTRLLRTLIFTFDVVLLGMLLGETQVGLYTAPYRICFPLLSLATVIQVSYLPAVTHAAIQGSDAVAAITGRTIYLATAVAAPMVTGGIILAVPVIETAFGPNYIEGAQAFRLLLVSIGCTFIYGAIHNALLAANRLKVELSVMRWATPGIRATSGIVLTPITYNIRRSLRSSSRNIRTSSATGFGAATAGFRRC